MIEVIILLICDSQFRKTVSRCFSEDVRNNFFGRSQSLFRSQLTRFYSKRFQQQLDLEI